MKARRSLNWTLGGTVLVSAISLLTWPESPPPLSLPTPAPGPALGEGSARSNPIGPDLDLAHLSARGFTPAGVDLFAAPAPVPPPSVAAPQPVAPAVQVIVSPPPAAPSSARYFGRVSGPDGALEIFLAEGDQVVLAKAGIGLRNGYVVERVEASSLTAPGSGGVVVLQHASSGQRQTVLIPTEGQ